MAFSKEFLGENGRPKLYMKRTRVEDMRDKDNEQNPGGLNEKFLKQTRPRQKKKLLRHFTARAFQQQAGNKQNYTRKRFEHVPQAPLTSGSPIRRISME